MLPLLKGGLGMDFGEKLLEKKRKKYIDKMKVKYLLEKSYRWEPFEQRYGLIRMWYVRELCRNRKKYRQFKRSYTMFRLMEMLIKLIYNIRIFVWYITTPV